MAILEYEDYIHEKQNFSINLYERTEVLKKLFKNLLEESKRTSTFPNDLSLGSLIEYQKIIKNEYLKIYFNNILNIRNDEINELNVKNHEYFLKSQIIYFHDSEQDIYSENLKMSTQNIFENTYMLESRKLFKKFLIRRISIENGIFYINYNIKITKNIKMIIRRKFSSPKEMFLYEVRAKEKWNKRARKKCYFC